MRGIVGFGGDRPGVATPVAWPGLPVRFTIDAKTVGIAFGGMTAERTIDGTARTGHQSGGDCT